MNLINHSQLSPLLGSRLLAIGLHCSYYCFISQKSTILNYWQLWRIMVFLPNFSTNRVQEWRNSDTFWKCIGSLMGIFFRLTGPAHPYHFENRNVSSVLMRIIWLEKSLEHDSLTGHIYVLEVKFVMFQSKKFMITIKAQCTKRQWCMRMDMHWLQVCL